MPVLNLVTIVMAFSVENPGFCVESREDSFDSAASDGLSQQYSLTSPSTLSSGDSGHRNCPRWHGRMNSFLVDKHSFLTKCRGSD